MASFGNIAEPVVGALELFWSPAVPHVGTISQYHQHHSLVAKGVRFMSINLNLLQNIECEYKFALNPAYAASFISEFCQKFNDVIALRYHTLPQDFISSFPLSSFLADPSKSEVASLANEYFDTKDDLLFAKYRSGLRLRRSSKASGVEQTLKCKGEESDGASHTHKELNVHVSHDLTVPDLSLFAAADLPAGMLELAQSHELLGKYKTDFVRQSITLTGPLFLTFEVAVDQGEIACTYEGKTHRSSICEVEFELKSVNPDYLNIVSDKVYDLDDLRLEFSALLNEVMLLVAGAPSAYLDAAHLFGLASHAPSPLVTSIQQEMQEQMASVAEAGAVLAQKEQAAAAPSSVEVVTAKAEALDHAAAHAAASNEHDDDESGEPLATSTDSPDGESALVGDIFHEPTAVNERAKRRFGLHPALRKEGGLIGVEPFSKLKRAVLLKTRYACDEAKQNDPQFMAQFKADLTPLRMLITAYVCTDKPSLLDFKQIVDCMAEVYCTAMGMANLFGTRENFENVRDALDLIISFAGHHRPTYISPQSHRRHRELCQDPDFNDLSMLTVSECSSMFIEINGQLWIDPFFHDLKRLLEEQVDLDAEQFKKLCRTSINNSFAIKSSEYAERIHYILKRQQILFVDEEVDSEVNKEQRMSERKLMALATQHHLKLMWNNI